MNLFQLRICLLLPFRLMISHLIFRILGEKYRSQTKYKMWLIFQCLRLCIIIHFRSNSAFCFSPLWMPMPNQTWDSTPIALIASENIKFHYSTGQTNTLHCLCRFIVAFIPNLPFETNQNIPFWLPYAWILMPLKFAFCLFQCHFNTQIASSHFTMPSKFILMPLMKFISPPNRTNTISPICIISIFFCVPFFFFRVRTSQQSLFFRILLLYSIFAFPVPNAYKWLFCLFMPGSRLVSKDHV